MNFQERYDFYTNKIFNNNYNYNFIIDKKYIEYKNNYPLYITHDLNNNINYKNEIKNNNISDFIIVTDDGYENNNMPCFQKTRKINNHSDLSLLLKLQFGRHWGPFYTFKDNYEWTSKKNEIIWRGAPTGNGDRIKFCDLYYKKYNVGLSCIFDYIPQYSYLQKSEISLDDFCKYKYIISIEGNEKDSGINWKLASNSVVLMKQPIYESWLMESKLEPWIHYIPLKEDFSDIDEIYLWCLNNDDKCREITLNANKFMDNFRNIDLEEKLINKIEFDYFKHIKLELI